MREPDCWLEEIGSNGNRKRTQANRCRRLVCVAPPDQGDYSFALVKHPADLASVSKEDAERAYSMDEVIRIINAWETRMIKEVKEHFPQSQIINIEDFKDDKEIPF